MNQQYPKTRNQKFTGKEANPDSTYLKRVDTHEKHTCIQQTDEKKTIQYVTNKQKAIVICLHCGWCGCILRCKKSCCCFTAECGLLVFVCVTVVFVGCGVGICLLQPNTDQLNFLCLAHSALFSQPYFPLPSFLQQSSGITNHLPDYALNINYFKLKNQFCSSLNCTKHIQLKKKKESFNSV